MCFVSINVNDLDFDILLLFLEPEGGKVEIVCQVASYTSFRQDKFLLGGRVLDLPEAMNSADIVFFRGVARKNIFTYVRDEINF